MMTNSKRSKQDLIDECLRRGLPVTAEDSTETLQLYLNVANNIDNEDDGRDDELFEDMEKERIRDKQKSLFSRLFFFFG